MKSTTVWQHLKSVVLMTNLLNLLQGDVAFTQLFLQLLKGQPFLEEKQDYHGKENIHVIWFSDAMHLETINWYKG